jgi:two-component system sensor histidine kinase KdpD
MNAMPDKADMLEEQINKTASMPRMKGELRIFLGYAPGVGKTYAMLDAAQRLRTDGIDVVVAHVASHDSPETAPLLQGMERLVSRIDSDQDMDVDAVLKRKPQVALVDDLARSNLPGSRHPRRYQDVEDLLNAGIDVFTTLNVYHIESLNDVVAQITGITFAETIPDRLLEQAQHIELIDLLPEDLLRRLGAGMVYPSEQIASARQTFFRMGNLIALRELAMRQVAAHVDEAMRHYMRSQNIAGLWAARERILVAISSSPISQRLLRTACRLAQQTHADWYAIHIETAQQSPMDEQNQTRLNETMWLAESLGANVMSITGQSVGDEILRFARENNITKIIVGQTLRSRWQEFWRGSIINEVIRRSGLIDVYVINSGENGVDHHEPRSISQGHDPAAYLFAVFSIILATLAGSLIRLLFPLNPENMVMLYLLAVVITALRSGFGPAVMASILSVVVFNFFFVPPQFTFRVADGPVHCDL